MTRGRNDYFKSVFSTELEKWKEKNHLSQEVFAERIGVEPNMISRYKKHGVYPSDKTLTAICREFGVSKEHFYPKTLYEHYFYDEESRKNIDKGFQKIEIAELKSAGINLSFWYFLLHTIPNLRDVLPPPNQKKDDDYRFSSKQSDVLDNFYEEDIEFIKMLQKDVSEYIRFQIIKASLSKRLYNLEINCTDANPDLLINSSLDHIFCGIILDWLMKSRDREDPNGID